jgi:hypothetical protein
MMSISTIRSTSTNNINSTNSINSINTTPNTSSTSMRLGWDRVGSEVRVSTGNSYMAGPDKGL